MSKIFHTVFRMVLITMASRVMIEEGKVPVAEDKPISLGVWVLGWKARYGKIGIISIQGSPGPVCCLVWTIPPCAACLHVCWPVRWLVCGQSDRWTLGGVPVWNLGFHWLQNLRNLGILLLINLWYLVAEWGDILSLKKKTLSCIILYHWNPCDLKPSFSSLRLTVSNLTCSWVKHSPGNWFPHPWVENVTKGKRAFRNGWPKHCNQKRCNQNALTKSYDEKGQTEEKFFSSAGRTFDRKDENQSQW